MVSIDLGRTQEELKKIVQNLSKISGSVQSPARGAGLPSVGQQTNSAPLKPSIAQGCSTESEWPGTVPRQLSLLFSAETSQGCSTESEWPCTVPRQLSLLPSAGTTQGCSTESEWPCTVPRQLSLLSSAETSQGCSTEKRCSFAPWRAWHAAVVVLFHES